MLRRLRIKLKLLWWALRGKPIIYNCVFIPPQKGNCIEIKQPGNSGDVLVANCTFEGKGYGTAITLHTRRK
jgi:hypothetical protein